LGDEGHDAVTDLTILTGWAMVYGIDRSFVDGDSTAHAFLRFAAWMLGATYGMYAYLRYRSTRDHAE
jgi:hypothetical protein